MFAEPPQVNGVVSRFGFSMNPVDLIKRDLGPDEWKSCRQARAEGSITNFQEELDIFPDHNIFLVHGGREKG